MLYLLKSYGPGEKCIYKVGYAQDLDKRFNQYYVSNPFIEKVSSRPGELIDEEILHAWLHQKSSLGFLMNEWYYSSDVISLFQTHLETCKKELWEIRNSPGFSSRVWDNIFTTLGKTLGDIEEDIDRGYIEKSSLPGFQFFYRIPKIYWPDYYEFWTSIPEKRLEIYAKFFSQHPDLLKDYVFLPSDLYNTYTSVGYEYLESCNFTPPSDMTEIIEEGIKARVYEVFEIGREYTELEISEVLSKVYEGLGIFRKSTPDTILDYFKTSISSKLNPTTGRLEFGHYIKARR